MKSAIFGTSEVDDLELDLESGHMAYCHASLIDLYVLYTPNFIEIGQTFCGRTYVCTDVPTDGRTFPPLMLLEGEMPT